MSTLDDIKFRIITDDAVEKKASGGTNDKLKRDKRKVST